MRRTPRTEFRDARSAAIESRKAMLERVGLRQAEVEPEPVGDAEPDGQAFTIQATVNRMLAQIYRESGGWPTPQPSDLLTDIQRAAELMDRYLMDRYRGFSPRWMTGMPFESPQTGLMPDAYRGGQHSSVQAMYDPITWPDEGYPCQLCWAVKRWPWEPMRSCPISVDVESTYCEKHGGKPARMTWGRTTWVDAGTIANLSAPTLAELTSGQEIPVWAGRHLRDALEEVRPEYERRLLSATRRAISDTAPVLDGVTECNP